MGLISFSSIHQSGSIKVTIMVLDKLGNGSFAHVLKFEAKVNFFSDFALIVENRKYATL
jgi:hypothetical protein